MFRLIRGHFCLNSAAWLAVPLLLSLVSMAQAQGTQPAGKANPAAGGAGPQILAQTHYKVDSKSGELSLMSQEIGSLSSLELLDYLRKNPKQNSFPNRAFLLVDSLTEDGSNQDLVWISYAFHNKAVRPLEILNGAVVWDPTKNAAYVVGLKSNSARVLLSVYRIDPQQKIGKYPVELDPKKFQEWPKETAPLTEFEISTAKIGFCGLKSIELSMAQDHLQILAARSGDSCRPVTFGLDLKNLKWSEVAPVEGIR